MLLDAAWRAKLFALICKLSTDRKAVQNNARQMRVCSLLAICKSTGEDIGRSINWKFQFESRYQKDASSHYKTMWKRDHNLEIFPLRFRRNHFKLKVLKLDKTVFRPILIGFKLHRLTQTSSRQIFFLSVNYGFRFWKS